MQNFHQPLQTTMEDNIKKATLKEKKRQTDDNVTALIDKNIDAETRYPEGHYRRQMLRSMLDLVLPLKELSDTIIDTQEAFETLVSTVSLIDDSIEFMNELMTVKDDQRYTVFTRLKSRKKLKKFMRNNRMRMLSVFDKMNAMANVSSQMQEALEKLSLQMQKQHIKQNKRYQKQKDKVSKGKAAFSGSFINVSTDKLINDRKKQLGLEVKDTASAAGGTTAAPSGKGGDYNIDDIV